MNDPATLQAWLHYLHPTTEDTPTPPLTYASGWTHIVSHDIFCPLHSHQVFEIVYHRAGRGITHLPGLGDTTFEEGEVIIYPPDQKHDQLMDGEGEDLCIHIHTPHIENCPLKGLLHIPRIENPWLRAEMEYFATGIKSTAPTTETIHNHRVTALLLALLETAATASTQSEMTPSQIHARKAETYIRKNYQHIKSIEDIAHDVGLSHDHLRHLFKTERGANLIQFLTEIRVDRAKSLLIHSKLPHKQIASLCGFKDEYYFSKVFTRHVHHTPGAFRRQHAK